MLPLAAALLITLPWLNPLASGPSPAVLPWLVSAACAVLVWCFSSRLTPQNMATSWLAAALVSVLMALLQYFGLAQALAPWVHHTGLGEAFANLRQRNQFATLTCIALVALLWLVAQWQSRLKPAPGATKSAVTESDRWLLAASGALLLALGNATSGSRTGLLQWLLIAVLTVMWSWRKQRPLVWLALGALGAYIVAALLLPGVLEWATGSRGGGLLGRFEESAGCSSRRVLWANVLHLIAQKPWLGWGWGELDFAHFMTLYPGERFCEILDNAHNLPLHLAVELGVPVALAVCGTGLWLVWRARPWHEAHPTRQMAWGVLAVILLHSMLEYPLWYGPFQMAFGLGIWLLGSRAGRFEPKYASKSAIAPVLKSSIAIIFIAFIAYAWWDYHRISQVYIAPAQRAPAYQNQTLEKIQNSWLFDNQVRFAELTITPLTPDNAEQINAMAHKLLHFSPEARVAEKVIESAVMLKRDDEARVFLRRLQAAYPDEHASWAKAQTLGAPLLKEPAASAPR